MATIWTPRWRHQKMQVGANARIRARNLTFENTTDWNWHLKRLSLDGLPARGTGVYDSQRNLADRLTVEIGITQKGDINYNTALGNAFFSGHHAMVSGESGFHVFNPPFPLEPEGGLVVELMNRSDSSGLVNPTVVFNGIRRHAYDGKMIPAQLASWEQTTLAENQSLTFRSNDLRNNGEDVFYLQEMLIQTEFRRYAVRVNPVTGIEWMPDPEPIPSGLIAPGMEIGLNGGIYAPDVYTFPQETILRPRQELNIELTNLSDADQDDILFGLYGLLEVH